VDQHVELDDATCGVGEIIGKHADVLAIGRWLAQRMKPLAARDR
jgi:hypothetical protein